MSDHLMSDQETFVSRLQFAKLEGCDEKQVRRGIERGVLTVNSEGKLAVSQAGSGWRKPRRDSALPLGKSRAPTKARTGSDIPDVRTNVRTDVRMSEPEVEDGETVADAAARIASQAAEVPELKESLARKEHFLALLRELEYREKEGSLVDLALAQQVLFEGSRAARDAWLNWPAKYAPQIAAALNAPADQVAEILNAYVNEQLHALGEPHADFSDR